MIHTFGRHIGAGRGNVNGGRQLPPNMPTQDSLLAGAAPPWPRRRGDRTTRAYQDALPHHEVATGNPEWGRSA